MIFGDLEARCPPRCPSQSMGSHGPGSLLLSTFSIAPGCGLRIIVFHQRPHGRRILLFSLTCYGVGDRQKCHDLTMRATASTASALAQCMYVSHSRCRMLVRPAEFKTSRHQINDETDSAKLPCSRNNSPRTVGRAKCSKAALVPRMCHDGDWETIPEHRRASNFCLSLAANARLLLDTTRREHHSAFEMSGRIGAPGGAQSEEHPCLAGCRAPREVSGGAGA